MYLCTVGTTPLYAFCQPSAILCRQSKKHGVNRVLAVLSRELRARASDSIYAYIYGTVDGQIIISRSERCAR